MSDYLKYPELQGNDNDKNERDTDGSVNPAFELEPSDAPGSVSDGKGIPHNRKAHKKGILKHINVKYFYTHLFILSEWHCIRMD